MNRLRNSLLMDNIYIICCVQINDNLEISTGPIVATGPNFNLLPKYINYGITEKR